MKKIIFFCLFLYLLCLISVFAINSYPIMDIGIISFGENKEELGYNKVGPGGIGAAVSTPKSFTINPLNNYLFFTDPVKERIVVYSLQLNYIREIIGNGCLLISVKQIKFDDADNLIIINGDYLMKIDKDGKKLFSIKYIYTHKTITSKGYYPIGGNVYFYDNDDKIRIINNTGEIINETENEENIANLYNNQMNNTKSFKFLDNQDYIYFKENNILVNGNRVLTTNKYIAKKQYYDHIKNQVKKETRNEILSLGMLSVTTFTPDFDVYDAMENFIGYDSGDNAYWNGWIDGKRVVIVLNILGEAIDCFEIDQKFKQQIVAPNGDVYMWEIKPEGVTFFKITRQW